MNRKHVIQSTIEVLVCLRLLRTVEADDKMNNGCELAEETLLLYFNNFLKSIIEIYGGIYQNIIPTQIKLN